MEQQRAVEHEEKLRIQVAEEEVSGNGQDVQFICILMFENTGLKTKFASTLRSVVSLV